MHPIRPAREPNTGKPPKVLTRVLLWGGGQNRVDLSFCSSIVFSTGRPVIAEAGVGSALRNRGALRSTPESSPISESTPNAGLRYDWTPCGKHDGTGWRKCSVVPLAHPSHPLVHAYFKTSGRKGASRLPGSCPLYGGTFAQSYLVLTPRALSGTLLEVSLFRISSRSTDTHMEGSLSPDIYRRSRSV